MKSIRLSLFALAASLACGIAHGQDYPNKAVKIVVPYAAGGLPDTMARLIGQRLNDALGQQFLVDNRGGAGGISGTDAVARQRPTDTPW